jgi:multidrug transporter EmrE-like cation transporter
MTTIIALLAGLLILQVPANLAFTYGSLHPDRYWLSFAVGNLLGVSSIWFMMQLYQRMNANVAMAVGGGLSFVLVQLALTMFFHGRINLLQWGGIATILAGTLVTILAGEASATARP